MYGDIRKSPTSDFFLESIAVPKYSVHFAELCLVALHIGIFVKML